MSISETMDIIAAGSPEWMRHGLCGSGEHDPELWFAKGDDSARAQRICRDCPVKRDCLEHAFLKKEAGVRGGMTEYSRSRLIGKLRRKRETAQSS